jgi:putative Holliday junction resolvase
MSIVLGFDFGMKHIGVAVGQSLTGTATPLGTIAAKDGSPNWDDIQSYISEWRPKQLLVGIPLNMDGSEQPITHAARRFAKLLLEHSSLPLATVDERLSSWEAKNRILEKARLEKVKDRGKLKSKSRKQAVSDLNAGAAAILVEQWLSHKQQADD